MIWTNLSTFQVREPGARLVVPWAFTVTQRLKWAWESLVCCPLYSVTVFPSMADSHAHGLSEICGSCGSSLRRAWRDSAVTEGVDPSAGLTSQNRDRGGEAGAVEVHHRQCVLPGTAGRGGAGAACVQGCKSYSYASTAGQGPGTQSGGRD